MLLPALVVHSNPVHAGEEAGPDLELTPETVRDVFDLAALGADLPESPVEPSGGGIWSIVDHPALENLGSIVGATFTDVLRNGSPDVFWAEAGLGDPDAPNHLAVNYGGENFVHVTGTPLDEAGTGRGCAWGDYDDDGDLDVYVARTDTNSLYRNDGPLTFTDVTTPLLAGPGASSSGPSWVDFDGDGDIDLFNPTGTHYPNRLLRNDGTAGFVDVTAGGLTDSLWAMSSSWVDYDNDGDPDVYICGPDPNRLYRNDGNGVFVDVTTPPLDDPGGGHGAAWSDLDNDGHWDLYITNFWEENRLFHNRGEGWFADVTYGWLGDPRFSSGIAWGDYDNDGFEDLFWGNSLAPNVLMRNLSGGGEIVFEETTELVLMDNSIAGGAAWGDHDEDGDVDLLYASLQTQTYSRLFRNGSQPGPAWLHVDLMGIQSNRFGISSRVRAVEGDLSQMREVDGGSSFATQNSLAVEFGFGNRVTDGAVDSVVVRWPRGNVQIWIDVPINQRVLIIEDSDPTPIRLSGFVATDVPSGIQLEWTTSLETEFAGFFVERGAAAGGPYRRLHDDILRGRSPYRYLDEDVSAGERWSYRLAAVDLDGTVGYYGPVEARVPPRTGRVLAVDPARPNPFATSTEIPFSLLAPSNVTITIHDVGGRRVRVLPSGRRDAGSHRVPWDGRDEEGRPVPAGSYWVHVEGDGISAARRLVRLQR